MTGTIIPAEQWPEDAHLHTWDSNGLGNWLRPSYGAWHLWASDIPLPPGHDWRVPVMRHQPVQIIDLEQFRKAVMRFKAMAELGVDVESMPMHFMKSQEKYAADVAEADRLLALIDGQANVRSSSEHSDSLTPVAHKKLQGLQDEGFIVNGVAIFNPTTGRRGLVDYLGYVGWQTSEKPSKGDGE